MTIEITTPGGASREIVDWRAGSPVYAGDEVEPEAASEPLGARYWMLKPGDLVCDWLGVVSPDNRGLLRMFVNLTIYAKLVALTAYLLA